MYDSVTLRQSNTTRDQRRQTQRKQKAASESERWETRRR
jgi:hypothetical protein